MADRLFLRNNGEGFKDRTDDTLLVGFDQAGRFLVSFGPQREPCRYKPANVAFVSTESIPFDGTALFANGKQQYYAIELHRLKSTNPEFGTRFEIISRASSGSTYTKVYLPSEFDQKEFASTISLFRYLQSVAEATKPDTPDEKIREYLPKQFGRLEFLQGTPADRMAHPEKAAPLRTPSETTIYPFGSNLSQMDAVDRALSNQLSLIEGPPGTGKTQTILNIIANLIMQDKTILVASPNNEATKNVVGKLKDEGFDFIAAFLGRRENTDTFVATQDKTYPQPSRNGRFRKKSKQHYARSFQKIPRLHETYISANKIWRRKKLNFATWSWSTRALGKTATQT